MKYIIIYVNLLFSFAFSAYSFDVQTPKQNIGGRIINFKNQSAITGATVRLIDTKYGAVSKPDGSFLIKDIPVGRYQLFVNAIGYEQRIMNIVLTSGKELDLKIELNEAVIETEEVVVTGSKGNFTPINESVVVSSTEFSIDDVQRFAGSRMDPARMAQNFAGVLGANDTRNDIIIRGGAPTELLWKLDGLDIPNPNHFATQGATGGPVSAINTNLLDNSDFLTGAFPSEYYDKMSGVFDLRTRRGNPNRYEFTFQTGFNGFELGAEGPVSSNSSAIASYRYSFLGLLDAMGIDFGFSGIPQYQDATIKYDWDINSNHKIALTGLWGISDIYIKESETNSVFTGDQDIKNGTDLFSLGLNYKYIISDKLYMNAIIGSSLANFRTSLDSITTDNEHKVLNKTLWFDSDNLEGFHSGKVILNYSPESRNFLNIGFESRYKYFKFKEQRYTNDEDTNPYKLDMDDNSLQTMTYINWNHRINDDLSFVMGLTGQYLELSKSGTIEPRAAISWNFLKGQSLNLGFGLHRQSLPLVVYYQDKNNHSLDFMQSLHYVAGYSLVLSDDAILKIEGYYKDLSNMPVEAVSSSFSLINAGANFGAVFTNEPLKSTGSGKSYGAELSFIKNFTNGYYITATASLVRQEYMGSDGVWRWGAFDNKYILNLLAGYELKLSESDIIEFAFKYTLAGGAPYTPIDETKSKQRGGTYYLDSEAFSLRKPDYSRFDLRIDFRQNLDNLAIISYISIENLFNTKNILDYRWDVKNNKIKELYQLGIFPIGGIKIEF